MKPFYTVGGNVKWCSLYGKQYGVHSKLNIDLSFNSTVPFLYIFISKRNENTST